MDPKLNKLKDRAAEWYKKGKYDKALDAFLTLVRADPHNPRWFLKLGETYKKLGQTTRAADAFRSAARQYAGQGFVLKAIAMCNLILGLDPQDEETQRMLASFHASQREAAGRPLVPAPKREEAPPAEPPASAAPERPAPESSAAPAAPEPPAPSDDRPLSPGERAHKRRTLPPGTRLDSLILKEVVPEARPQDEGLTPLASGVFEIPLDEELEAAFQEAVAAEQAPAPRLPPTPLFSSLTPGSLRSLVEKVTIQVYQAGERIVKEGDPGNTLYVVVEGEVKVYREGPPRRELARLGEGAFFGEIAVITRFPRTSSVEAACETTVLEISTDVIGDVIDEYPEVLKVLLRFFRDRLINSLVETSELFAPFAREDRQALASRFVFLEADAGAVFLQQERRADGLYLLLCGEVTASYGSDNVRFGPGELFGEAALLGEGGSPCTVAAETKCWLLKLDRMVFREVIMTHPQVLIYVSELADRRRRAAQEPRREPLPLH
jgi:CRP-like cAMP-binding protein